MGVTDHEEHLRREERLRRLLEPDEHVIWQDRPDRVAYIWSYAPAAAFGAVWLAMVSVGLYAAFTGAYEREPGLWFWAGASIFVLIGLSLAVVMPLEGILGWRRVGHALTSHRVLSHFTSLGRTFHRAARLNSIIVLDLTIGLIDRWRGTGTIAAAVTSRDRAVLPTNVNGRGIMLSGVRDPKNISRIIDRAREQACEGSESDGLRAFEDRQRHEEHLLEMLQPGEQVLWQGKPDGRAYVWLHAPVTAFGAFWLSVSAWLTYLFISAERNAAGLLPWAILLPFLAIGLYLAVAKPLEAVSVWRNIAYVVTPRRLLLIREAWGRQSLSAAYLDSVAVLDLRIGALNRLCGTGTIIAAGEGARPTRWDPRPFPGPGIAFEGVGEPEAVLRVIGQARDRARKQGG